MADGRPLRRSLDPAEVSHVRELFGVADEQVLRDHAISHVLAALSATDLVDDLLFIGGTALSRTFLPRLRLSEDIDLISAVPRSAIGPRIEAAVAAGLRRTHGSVSWAPALADTRGSGSSVLLVGDSIRIRVQLIGATGYSRWPTEVRPWSSGTPMRPRRRWSFPPHPLSPVGRPPPGSTGPRLGTCTTCGVWAGPAGSRPGQPCSSAPTGRPRETSGRGCSRDHRERTTGSPPSGTRGESRSLPLPLCTRSAITGPVPWRGVL